MEGATCHYCAEACVLGRTSTAAATVCYRCRAIIEFGRQRSDVLEALVAEARGLHQKDHQKRQEAWFNRAPLVEGGQGRTAESIVRDGSWLAVLLVVFLTLVGVVWMVTALK